MSGKLTRKQKEARARRQKQIIIRGLVFLIVIVAVLSFVINSSLKSRKQESVVSAQTAEAADAGETVLSAGTNESIAGASSADASSEISSESSSEPSSGSSSETETGSLSETEGEPVSGEEEIPGEDVVPAEAEEPSNAYAGAGQEELHSMAVSLNRTVAKAKERQDLLNMNDDDLAAALYEREVPQELIEFMQEYPETREFVVDYLFQPEQKPSMDISGEVTMGVIPHFLQWDSRWGYEMYGDSTIAVSACGPTALSEVYSGLTGKTDMNPYEMAQWAQKMGYHIPGSGTAWEMMLSGAYALGLEAWGISTSEEAIMEALGEGHPIIAAVAPGDFTYFGHFIVLVSADNEGNISIRDSNSNIRTQRTWTCDELLWQINQMWAYDYQPYQSDY